MAVMTTPSGHTVAQCHTWLRRRRREADGSTSRQEIADVPTEVARHLQNQAADLLYRMAGAVSDELFDVGIHARRCLGRAHRADNQHAGVQAALRDDQPARLRRGQQRGVVMLFAEDQNKSSRLADAGYGGTAVERL